MSNDYNYENYVEQKAYLNSIGYNFTSLQKPYYGLGVFNIRRFLGEN